MSGEIELPINAGSAISIVIHNTDVTPTEREYAAECLEALLAYVERLNEQVEGPLEALRAELANVSDVNEHLGTLNMELRAENERLKADLQERGYQMQVMQDIALENNKQLEQANAELMTVRERAELVLAIHEDQGAICDQSEGNCRHASCNAILGLKAALSKGEAG